MSPEVKFCRNVVACTGVLVFLASIASIVTHHSNWRSELGQLGTAFMCLTIVREVNRREGDWHKEVFVRKRPMQSERIPASDDEVGAVPEGQDS